MAGDAAMTTTRRPPYAHRRGAGRRGVTRFSARTLYSPLNSAKFVVILAMEEGLPVRVFGGEWDRLRRDPVKLALRRDALRSWAGQYRELGRVERFVPWVFALIYIAEIIRQAI
jgi:hypothetical protein